MIIRKIEEKDFDSCLQIYNYYIENTVFSLAEAAVDKAAFVETVKNIQKNYEWLVAEESGVIVGFSYLSAFNERSGYRLTADLSIYIAPNCRERGIGTQLLAETEKCARSLGIRNIISIITAENIASCRFHEKNGFMREGYFPEIAVKGGRLLDVTYYRKRF